MDDTIIIAIVWATIVTLLLLITILLLASILRRGFNERKYRQLDGLRERYGTIIHAALEAGDLARVERECAAPPKSIVWQAVEDVLLRLIEQERRQDDVKLLFSRLGYIAHYEKQLSNRSIYVRALSIDKLGKAKSSASVPKLIGLLDSENPETVSVTVRSLSNIGGLESLRAISERLPIFLGASVVASKTMQTVLLAFGADAIPFLAEQGGAEDVPEVASSKLEILSRLPAEARSVNFAIRHLASADAEVRSKALKVLGRVENIGAAPGLPESISPLLQDPVWFVRLQAIRSVRVLQCTEAVGPVSKLLFDPNWQVRNEAVQSLIMLGEFSLDSILNVLTGEDKYSKDSICEEIEKTGFSARLIENLTNSDAGLRKKSRQILDLMCSLGFSTTLEAYTSRCDNKGVQQVPRGMVKLELRP